MKSLHHRAVRIAFALLLLLAGCDAFGESDADPALLSVHVTDAPFPFDLVASTEVTISSVWGVSEEHGPVALSEDERTLNLLDLQDGVTAELVSLEEVPVGMYSKILLEVANASVTLNDGETFDLQIPSESIQIPVDDFRLDEGEAGTVLLDFDVSQSFVVQGNPNTPAGIKGFLFKPVLRPLGFVSDDDDDADDGAELQGVIETATVNHVEIGGTRYLLTDETEFDGGGLADLTPGTVVEVEFIQAANGAYVATKIEIEDDGNGNVRETSGIVTSVDVVDGTPFVTVGELRFEIVPGETEFEGVSGFDGLVAGESFVEVDYTADIDGEGLIALEIEVEDGDDD